MKNIKTLAILNAVFFLVHLVLSRFFPSADPFILPVVMLLTGLSFLTLLSLQDPLRDRFLARSTLGARAWPPSSSMKACGFCHLKRTTGACIATVLSISNIE